MGPKQFSSCLIMTAMLVACSPSDPKLSYSGIDAQGAITLLDKAQYSQERDIVLNKLKSDRRVGFDWEYFWRQLPESGRFQRFDEKQRDRALSLSADSCSVQGFQQFGEFVLKIQTGFSFVTGVKRVCAQPLSEELFGKYVNFFAGRTWTANSSAVLPMGETESVRELARLMISQVQTEGSADKSKLLGHLSADRWYGLIRRLLGVGSGELAAQLVQIHQTQFGGLRFLENLMLSWMNRPQEFEGVLAKNQLIDVARILAADPAFPYVTKNVETVKWVKTFELIEKKFAAETTDLDSVKFDQALHTLDLLELIPERIAEPPPFGHMLKWYEGLLRSVERGLPVEQTALLGTNLSNPRALWLKLRRTKELSVLEESQLETSTSSSKIGQALLLKLKLKTAKSERELHAQIKDYCEWLDGNEVKTRTVAGPDFQWEMTQEPGCLKLEGNQSPSDTIKRSANSHVEMAFDSVLVTEGWNLKLSAPSFDGSFVDLSTALKHPDLPVEPALEQDHAIAFPLLVGIRVATNIFPEGPGTYYFIYHYTWRKAAAGRAGVAVPLEGFPGGSFEAQVASKERSVEPVIASLGSAGQKGVPRRKGGNASESEIFWVPLSYELKHSEPEFPGAQAVPLAEPSLKKIDILFKNGEVDENGNTKLFIEPARLVRNYTQAQKDKAFMACPNGESDFDCWNNLTLAAANELWTRYAELCPQTEGQRICPDSVLEQHLDRLNTAYFKEDEGALGPINPDGAEGKSGFFTLEATQ